jgi:hypothetical protein
MYHVLAMGRLAEKMIAEEMQEKSRVKQEGIVLQNKIIREKKHETGVSAMHLFFNIKADNEWFWKLIAYTYFTCKTLGLLVLIGFLFFGRINTALFALIFIYCCYLNLKLYRYIS